MDRYISPVCQVMHALIFVKTQATGGTTTNQTPGNPSTDCASASCTDDQGVYHLDLVVSWTDESGTPVPDYTVVVDVDGSSFSLTDATSGCSISEVTSGNYELNCGTVLSGLNGSDCNCGSGSNVTVVSISDGVDTLNVSGVGCVVDPGSCV